MAIKPVTPVVVKITNKLESEPKHEFTISVDPINIFLATQRLLNPIPKTGENLNISKVCL